MKTHSLKKYLLLLSLAITLSCAYFLLAGSVSKEITVSDKAAIEKLMVKNECSEIPDFEAEIACIKSIQRSIKELVPHTKCALPGTPIEPEQFIIRQHGCCYDRARFAEKALNYYGFETRHVAMYEQGRYGIFSLLAPGTNSHATSEVKTRKGWMGVDSNHPFLLITTNGTPQTYKSYKDYKDQLAYRMIPAEFYNRQLIVVYGLYSRHGKFHGINLPGPEFNLNELVFNLK
jgi:hypothetical protein